jgi:uncharacterized membrane protein
MTLEQFVTLLSALAVLIAAVTALLFQVNTMLHKQDLQHAATNSRMDQLVQVTAEAAHSAGVAEGKATAESGAGP